MKCIKIGGETPCFRYFWNFHLLLGEFPTQSTSHPWGVKRPLIDPKLFLATIHIISTQEKKGDKILKKVGNMVHPNAHTLTHTHSPTQIQIHTDTHIHRDTHTHKHTNTRIHSHKYYKNKQKAHIHKTNTRPLTCTHLHTDTHR